jgi:hypothetical protein
MAITEREGYISGRVALEYLNAMRAIVGDHGVATLLRRSKLISLINKIFSVRHERIFPVGGLSALSNAVIDIFGESGLRTVVYTSAKASFQPGFSDLQVVRDAQRLIRGVWEREDGWTILREVYPDTETRFIFIHVALDMIAKALRSACGWQTAVHSDETHFFMDLMTGGECSAGVRINSTSGFYTLGIMRGGIRYLLQSDDYPCLEVECRTTGAAQCMFSVRKEKFSRAEQETGKTSFLRFPGSLAG